MTRAPRLFAPFVLSIALLSARAEDSKVLASRIQISNTETSLDAPGLLPWHLKLEVEIFDEQGRHHEQGTIESWWIAPGERQTVYTLPSYTATELVSSTGIRRSKGAGSPSTLLDLILQQFLHPMPTGDAIEQSVPDLRKQTLGKLPLDCIMLDQTIKGVVYPPLGLFPTYCFDTGNHFLRLTYQPGSQTIVRNAVGTFQGRHVATSIAVSDGAVPVGNAHVATLESRATLMPPALDENTLELIAPPEQVEPGVMAGYSLRKIPPIYPPSALSRHASGSVVIHAVIGRDGHVRSMRLISVPDPELAIAALGAVRSWTYKPYLSNGVPTEVDTTITVNFNFNLAR